LDIIDKLLSLLLLF